MRRKVCREQIFKLLFQVEFNNKEEYKDLAERYCEILKESEESKLTLTDEEQEYVQSKYLKITEHIDSLDEQLNAASDDWKTSRMGKVELAILRLALYEMNEDEDIPESVAINEAVELAKKYGSDEAYAFVNGILAKCAKNTDAHKEAENKTEKVRPWKNKQGARIVVKGSQQTDS